MKPEEIDESMDLSLLNKLLLGRITGLSTDEGKEKCKVDCEVLEKWLSLTVNDNGGMTFPLPVSSVGSNLPIQEWRGISPFKRPQQTPNIRVYN